MSNPRWVSDSIRWIVRGSGRGGCQRQNHTPLAPPSALNLATIRPTRNHSILRNSMFAFLERFPLGSIHDHLPGRRPLLFLRVVMHLLDDLVSADNFACTSVVPSPVFVSVNKELELKAVIGKGVFNRKWAVFIRPQLICVPFVRCFDLHFPKRSRVEREHLIAVAPPVLLPWDVEEQASLVVVRALAGHEHG